jgi:mono/diheme cytochrome c family protein
MKSRRLVVIGTMSMVLAAAPLLAADGAAVWKANCAKCHGETGHADTPAGKALKVPVVAGNAEIAAMSEADLMKKAKENPKHGSLKVSEEDFAAAIAHVKELAGKK